MSGRCTVLLSDRDWRVACVDDSGCSIEVIDAVDATGPEALAARAAEAIDALGGSDHIVLALASSWCLSATIRTDALERGGRRQAMGYLLEEHLPISAEDSTVDYIERRGWALGVAADLHRLKPIVDALETAGLVVCHVCPLALLAASQALANDLADRGRVDAVLLNGDDAAAGSSASLDLIELEDARPTAWWWLADPRDRDERLSALAQREMGEAQAVRVLVGSASDHLGGMAIEWVSDASLSSGVYVSAAREASAILNEVREPLIDLRRGALARPGRGASQRRAFVATAGAMVFLLLCVIVALQWRATGYEREADRLFTQQQAVFASVFPDRPARGSLRNQLLRERDTLAGVSGAASGGGDGVNEAGLFPSSGLVHLHAVLGAMPRDRSGPRYQVATLQIEPELIKVSGSSDSHVSAARLAEAVAASGAYRVDPPNSRSEGEGVFSYRFTAYPVTDSKGAEQR